MCKYMIYNNNMNKINFLVMLAEPGRASSCQRRVEMPFGDVSAGFGPAVIRPVVALDSAKSGVGAQSGAVLASFGCARPCSRLGVGEGVIFT